MRTVATPKLNASAACAWRAALAPIAALAACLALGVGGGCAESAIAAAGATAGFGLAQGQAESFIRGELKAARMAPLNMVHEAVVHAMTDLQVQVHRDRLSQYDAALGAKAPGGREVKIYLKADSPVMTRITVRIGLLGDSAVSSLVMQRIDAALDSLLTRQPAATQASSTGSES
jgi:hypothetical protein